MPAEQQSHIYVNDAWRAVDEVFVYTDGAWKRVNQAHVNHSGAWRRWYAYDATAPTVSSFNLSGLTAGATYGPSQTSATYILTFSEAVTGLAIGDLSFVGTSTGWTIGTPTNPSSDQKTYQIPLTATSPTSGTVQIRLANSSVSDLIDGSAYNVFSSGPVNSQSFIIDAETPSVVSFSSNTSGASRTVVFNLTFSESVTGLTTSDIQVGSGTSTGWQVSSVAGSGAAYTVTFTETSTGSTIDGTLVPRLLADGVTDLFGNTGPTANATATSFAVVRKPPTPSITANTSVNTSLHNRRIDTTASMPASLTSIDTVYAYYYDSNDNYIASSVLTNSVTATTSAFTSSFAKDVGRNPGTKYYVRIQTRNTDGLFSDVSARSEITTGADQTPPTVATPTIDRPTVFTDPGYPGRSSNTRDLRINWNYSALSNEVGSITVYLAGTSWDITRPALGWGSGGDSRTATGLTWNTSYSGFIRSHDIYGGVNSTADSGSASNTTQAPGSTAQANFTQTYTNNPLRRVAGSASTVSGTNSGSVAEVFDGDLNTYWISGSQPASSGIRWQGSFSGYPAKTGAFLDRVYLTSISIRTVLQHTNIYTCLLRNITNVWDSQNAYTSTDQYSGQYFLTQITGQGGDQWTTTWAGDYTLATPANDASGGRFTLYFPMNGRSYNGTLGITNTNLRAIIREVDFTAVVSSYNPAYNW
jgi:hypothetical protein